MLDPNDNFAYAMGTYEDLHSYVSPWYEFGDTEQQWQHNLRDPYNKKQLQSLGWNDPNCITYDINEFGFRSTDFSQPINLAVFGDSYTMGVGLPDDCLWHAVISQQQGWQVANFGVAGAASRTCFRLANYWLPKIQPDYAIFVMPHSTRLEVATQASDGCMTTPYLVSQDHRDNFLRRWWSTDYNSELEREITQQALQHICALHDIRCMFFPVEFFEAEFYDHSDVARDLRHGGRVFQQQVANYIQDKIHHGQWY